MESVLATANLRANVEENLPCSLVNNLAKNTEEQCKFLIDNDCLEEDATIDYVDLVFCKIDYDMRLVAITLVVFLVVVLFLNLSAVADEFLCPSLLTVAKNLRMSDSLAGVTLLAFGNGCPDIFSSLAAASSGRPELIVGELLGAGIFCTSIVAGLIFISAEFKIARRPLLRDTSFYLLAVYLIWLFCSQGQVTFYGALAFIIIYVIYLFIALVGQAVHSRLRGEYPIAELCQQSEKPEESAANEEEEVSAVEKKVIYRRLEELMRRKSSGQLDVKSGQSNQDRDEKKTPAQKSHSVTTIQISTMAGSAEACFASNHTLKDLNSSNITKSEIVKQSEARTLDGPPSTTEPASGGFNLDEFDHFLANINPLNSLDWAQSSLFARAMGLLRAPILLLTIFTVPVVDNEKPNANWCRLLNSFHCFAIPAAVMTLIKMESSTPEPTATASVGDLQRMIAANGNETEESNIVSSLSQDLDEGLVYYSKYLVLVAGLALALYVFNTTSASRAPRFHSLFAYSGFLMSVVWIYKLANEIISLLKTVGIIFSMSDTAIGLGFLAWGNSLGDIVANLTLAQAGYARMALGASIGAPLLNLLLGFGLSFTISLKPGDSVEVDYNDTMTLLAGTLSLILLLLMASTFLPQSRSKKPFGYLLIACYGLYFLSAVCLECDLL